MAKWEEIYQKIIVVMNKGAADPQVQEGVGELRQHITNYFYNCTPEIFRGPGGVYVAGRTLYGKY